MGKRNETSQVPTHPAVEKAGFEMCGYRILTKVHLHGTRGVCDMEMRTSRDTGASHTRHTDEATSEVRTYTGHAERHTSSQLTNSDSVSNRVWNRYGNYKS